MTFPEYHSRCSVESNGRQFYINLNYYFDISLLMFSWLLDTNLSNFSIPQATNIKTGLHYCLYRIHGYRLSNVKVTQLVDLWKKIQHSSVTQLREVFTTKAFNDNCKS